MEREYEVIEHGVIVDFKVFLVNMEYRSPHIHSDFELGMVLDGDVTVISDTRELELGRGGIFMMNPFSMHELKAPHHALLLSIQIRKSFCMGYYPAIGGMSFEFCNGREYLTDEQNEALQEKALQLAWHYFKQDAGFEFLCTGLLNEIMYVAVQNLPYRKISQDEKKRLQERYDRIHGISEYINANYTEKLLLGELAEKEGLTLSYLSHFFRDAFSMSFQEYLSVLRCEKARQLLLLTDHNLLDISMECGFSDVKYLNREFIRHYGYHPREYRKRFNSKDMPEQQSSLLSTQEFLSRQAALVLLEKYSS